MKFVLTVLLPLCFQLLFTAAIVFATNGTGSFVGLGALLLGLVAIPLTALINWSRARAKPPLPAIELAAKTLFTTLVFPVAIIALYAIAS